jgi:hypothetical protein
VRRISNSLARIINKRIRNYKKRNFSKIMYLYEEEEWKSSKNFFDKILKKYKNRTFIRKILNKYLKKNQKDSNPEDIKIMIKGKNL